MKNLMDMYLNFTEKRIKKYMRIIYSQYYNDAIVSEYLKTYVNARYYNIRNTEKPARAFYLRIIDELEFKQNILVKRNDSEIKVGLIIVDIDYFKFYNDRFGHPQGDVCLKKVSEVIRYFALEEGAVPSRIGGEEFVDMESTSKKLYDGDFVIMMSDGLMEAVESQEKEEALGEIIMGIKSLKPKEMAHEILSRTLELTKSNKRDDMTVMVT